MYNNEILSIQNIQHILCMYVRNNLRTSGRDVIDTEFPA